MLFLLSKPAWLERFAAGRILIEWLRNDVKLKTGEVAPREFQAEVRREMESRGIVPVAPERCVYALTKQEARDKCLEAKWPTPFFPVMLQTRPKGAVGFVKKGPWKKEESGVFILFSCWPDALFALISMAGTKTFRGYAADFVFENQVVDFGPKQLKFPCRIILDCDAKVAEFNNEYDIEELQTSVDQVAPWFVKQLVTIKAIKPTDEVVCYQKTKSRPGKASAHLIFGIMGISTDDIREVLDRIFVEPWRKEQERLKLEAEKATKRAEGGEDPPKKKKQKLVSKKLPEPWQIADRSTMHGRNQFSTLFFKNPDKNEQEFPFVEWKLVIVNGEVKKRLRLPYTRAESGPENPKALHLLHCCCYSSFMPEFVTLSPDFMMERGVRRDDFCYAFIFFRDTAWMRLELTRTPNGGRQKKGGQAGLVLDQARHHLRPPPNRRASCRRGWSQPFKGSRAGVGMLSTPACPVSIRCTRNWCSLSPTLSVPTQPTSMAPSSALTMEESPESTRPMGFSWWWLGRSCMLHARTSRATNNPLPLQRLVILSRSLRAQRNAGDPGSSSRRSRTANWRRRWAIMEEEGLLAESRDNGGGSWFTLGGTCRRD